MKKTDLKTEQNIINMYNNGYSMKEVGMQFNTSAATVLHILLRNNVLCRTRGGIYKLDDNYIIEKYKSGDSCLDIANELNVSFHSISNILEKYNIKRNNIYHNLNLIEDYWENIDSYDKAYFLGFLITDGNIRGTAVRLILQSRDKHILETFAKKTKNENKLIIDKRDGSLGFSVRRLKWVNDLSKYGVIPNKTFSINLPILSDDMMPHLIRGLIDGDGWIIKSKSSNIGFCSGCETIVVQLRDFLVKKLGITNVSVLHYRPKLWWVKWGSIKDIKKIGQYLYTDKEDCYLIRKYNKYISILDENTNKYKNKQ